MTSPKWHAYLAPHATEVSRYELVFDAADFPPGQTTLSGIEVDLFELDKSSGIPKEISDDDRLGSIDVDLALNNGQIEIQAAKFTKPSPHAMVVAGIVDIEAGPETFAVPVYMESSERSPDKDPLWAISRRHNVELGLSVHRQATKFYSTFDTNFPDSTGVSPFVNRGLRGPVLTYIVYPSSAQDETIDNFMLLYDNAEGYWKPRSDMFLRRDDSISLESIIRDLRDNRVGIGGARTIWSQVNIVTHGTHEGIYMPLRNGDSLESLNQFHVSELKSIFHNHDFDSIDPKFTQIHLRACTIGRDAGLLKKMSEAFGGCKVFAPDTHFMAYLRYQRNSRQPPEFKEYLYRQYWAFLPGVHPTIGRNAGAAALAAAPQKHKRTDGTDHSEGDFRDMISDGRKSRAHDANATYFVIEDSDITQHLTFDDQLLKTDLQNALSTKTELEFAVEALDSNAILKGFPIKIREALRLDGHTPMSLSAPEWGKLDSFAAALNYEVVLLNGATNNPSSKIDDGPVAGAPDVREIKIHVGLVHAFIEICERAVDTTDVDFASLPEVASSQ